MDSKFIFIADYDYFGQNSNELSVQIGDSVKVTDVNNQLYYGVNLRTEEFGWVSSSYGHIRKKSPYDHLSDNDKLMKRKNILHTIIKNESDFISKIHEFIYYVINPLNLKDTHFKKLFLSDSSVAVSFHILEELFKVTSNFISILKKSIKDNEIAQAFQQFAPSLQLFAQYASENAKLLNIVKSNFRQLLQIIPDNYSIEDIIIQPIEHYNLYSSFFQEFVWLNPSTTVDVNALDASLGLIISYTRIVDEKIREEERNWLLLNLQSQFTGDPVIFTPNRILLKEGEILRVKFSTSDNSVDVKTYYAHLFNDAFIYSARNRTTGAFKLYKAIDLKTSSLHLGVAHDKEPIFYFETKDNNSEPVHLRLTKSEDTSEWIALIQEQIDCLKIKKKPRRVSAFTMNCDKVTAVDTKMIGIRAQLTHKFLLEEIQFADLMAAMNITVIQPLIAASKGGMLNAIQIMNDEQLLDKHSEALFDKNAQNSSTNTSQSFAIKDALQDPDVKIFLRAAESISSISREFCNGLESLCKSTVWSENTELGAYFNSVSVLSLYNQFKSYTDGQQAMHRILCSPSFAGFYRDAEAYLSNFPGSFQNKLELPTKHVKDIGKYLLELKTCTPDTINDRTQVIAAIEALSFVTTEIDELIRVKTNFELLLKIQSCFVLTQSPVIQHLATMSRICIKVGDLKKVCRKKNKLFRFWLFNDYLIYGNSLGGDSYCFNRALDLHNTSIKVHISNNFSHAIEVRSAEKSFIIIASSETIQKEWIDSIQSAKAHLIGTSTENTIQTADVAPLWVPDNSSDACIECKKEFSFWNRRHHCRKCGSLVCSEHLKNKMLIPHIHKTQLQKVCDNCFYYKPTSPVSCKTNIPSTFASDIKIIIEDKLDVNVVTDTSSITKHNNLIISSNKETSRNSSNTDISIPTSSVIVKDSGTLFIPKEKESPSYPNESISLISPNNTKKLMESFNKSKVDSPTAVKRNNVRAPPPPPSNEPPQESILIASMTRENNVHNKTLDVDNIAIDLKPVTLSLDSSKDVNNQSLSLQTASLQSNENISNTILPEMSSLKIKNKPELTCETHFVTGQDLLSMIDSPLEQLNTSKSKESYRRRIPAPPPLNECVSVVTINQVLPVNEPLRATNFTDQSLEPPPKISKEFKPKSPLSQSIIKSEVIPSTQTTSELSNGSQPEIVSVSVETSLPIPSLEPPPKISKEFKPKSPLSQSMIKTEQTPSTQTIESQIEIKSLSTETLQILPPSEIASILPLTPSKPPRPPPPVACTIIDESTSISLVVPPLVFIPPPPIFIPPPPPPPMFIPPPPHVIELIIEDDEFTRKYKKMKELLPEGAVKQKMRTEGFSDVDIDNFISGKITKLNPPDMFSVIPKELQNTSNERRKGLISTRNICNDININNVIYEKKSVSMLDAICRRRNSLKKLTDDEKSRVNKPININGGLLGTLALAMTKRRFNMKINENSDSDSSGWDTDSDGE